jgi:hypothetical protein
VQNIDDPIRMVLSIRPDTAVNIIGRKAQAHGQYELVGSGAHTRDTLTEPSMQPERPEQDGRDHGYQYQ